MRNMRIVALLAALGAGTGIALRAADKGDPAKGKDVFDQSCAVCHNADSDEKKWGPG